MHRTFGSLLLALLIPAAALAQDPQPTGGETPPPAPPATVASPVVAVGLHVGPSFPLSPLKATFLPRLEVGFMPGGGGLMVFGTGTYMAPVASGTIEDARVPGGSYDWELRQQEIVLGAGVAYRFSEPGATVHPEVAAGPMLYILKTTENGSADGAAFGETVERYAQPGVMLAAGAGVDVGPGRVVGRLEFAMSPLVGDLTGESTTSALSPTVGYRLLF